MNIDNYIHQLNKSEGLWPQTASNRSRHFHTPVLWLEASTTSPVLPCTLYNLTGLTQCLEVLIIHYIQYKANSHFSGFLFQMPVHASQVPWF